MENNTTIRTVGDLLNFAKESPAVLDRAHSAVWRAISTFRGEKPVPLAESDNIRLQNLYRDQPSRRMRFPAFQDLLGIDPVLAEVGEYFRAAGSGEEEARQVLAVGGPHGCGKTTLIRDCIAEAMKELLFYEIEGCPWHELPLHAIPKKERNEFFSQFFPFKGELCRTCEERLQGREFSGDWRSFPVMPRSYRLSAGIGMLRVEDSLPDVDRGKFPSEWYSIFKCANGGVLFIDLSSKAQPEKFRSMIGNLVADGTIRAPDQTEVHLDLAVVSVSNTHLEEEEKTGALGDRIIPVKFHLPLDVQAELKIHHRAKRNNTDTFHFVPGVEEALSRMEIATRLDPSQWSLTLTPEDALLFYAGGARLADDKKSLARHTYGELREKRPFDGANGLTVRRARILRNKMGQYQKCIGIQHVLSMLRDPALYRGIDKDVKERMKPWVVFDPDAKGNYALGKMEEWYRGYLRRDLVRGWIGFKRFEEMKQQYFKDYLNHALHFTMKRNISDETTIQELPVDEKMLRLIEGEIGVKEDTKEEFRSGITAFFRNQKREVLEDHIPLSEAIERVIMFAKKDKDIIAKIDEVREAMVGKPQDPQKAKKKVDAMAQELRENGYKGSENCCWENIRTYANKTIFAE
ncbi:MAG: hypothetical protein HYT37_01145 [Candidatus Sungbacteria bacterium]|nr:hypothetical protein [Candidatus Sungbacteria bacterium]